MSSEALERAEAIRATLLDSSNALVPGTMTEGEFNALAALDALLADVARLEQERDEMKCEPRDVRLYARIDALAAELAVARKREQRYREALEQWPQDGSVHEPGCFATQGDESDCDCFTRVARAALVDEPAATLAEPEGTGEETHWGTVDPGVATLSGSANAAADKPGEMP